MRCSFEPCLFVRLRFLLFSPWVLSVVSFMHGVVVPHGRDRKFVCFYDAVVLCGARGYRHSMCWTGLSRVNSLPLKFFILRFL